MQRQGRNTVVYVKYVGCAFSLFLKRFLHNNCTVLVPSDSTTFNKKKKEKLLVAYTDKFLQAATVYDPFKF